MPNRILKESITTSEDIDSLSPDAEILFYRLMVKADDFGIYYGNAKIIRSNCYPLRVDDTPAESVEEWLDELEAAGLIERYRAADERIYLRFVKWQKHQQIRAKKPKFPQFTDECERITSDDIGRYQKKSNDIKRNQKIANVPVIQSNPIQSYSYSESNPKEAAVADEAVDMFERWWAVYPKKVGKEAARKAFAKVKVDAETLIAAVVKQKASEQWTKEGGRYIPNPATWLNQGRWEDELAPAKTETAPPPKQNTGRNTPPSAKFSTAGIEPFIFGTTDE